MRLLSPISQPYLSAMGYGAAAHDLAGLQSFEDDLTIAPR